MNSNIVKWLDTARIDIKNHGVGNDVNVRVIEGNCCNITKPHWFSKDGIGAVLETSDKHIILELECLGEGNLEICLQGIDRHMLGGPRLPLWVDYSRMAVNRNVIFWELKPLWHDKVYYYVKQVSDGEKVNVEISWLRHRYEGKELAELLSVFSINNIYIKEGVEK